MRLVGFITEPATVRQILAHAGEPTTAPAIAPTRSPPVEANAQQLMGPEAVFVAIPELEFDQMANLAAVAVFLEVASLRAIVRAAARGCARILTRNRRSVIVGACLQYQRGSPHSEQR